MFQSARIKLTAWYLLIIMIISVAFSVGIHRILCNEIDRFDQAQRNRIERRIQEGMIIIPPDLRINIVPQQVIRNQELIEEIKQRLLIELIIINGTIFIAAGGLGYLLAGRTLEPIRKMVEEQNRFVSDASHEIRTPLTSLKTSMEVFLRAKKHTITEAKSLVEENMAEVHKLQRLSDNLLALGQIEKPHRQDSYTSIQVSDIIRSAVHEVAQIASVKQIIVNVNGSDGMIFGNRDDLIRVLVVLLDNAIKYSKPDTTISITAKNDKNKTSIIVSDSGIGIDEKDIPHIFDRFYRADAARSHNGNGGYGLGLSIAKKIVDMHKGSIMVKSELHKGSTFTICLPDNQKCAVDADKNQ